ncbi:MAG: rhodanese-like domain-containing protein [Microscillaceae bacterium]|nr:rhodanese-like domain-containing protein [Microscillaceae bacterium]
MSYENVQVSVFKEKIQSEPDAIILDVRSEPELSEGFVPNHTMINFLSPDFAEKVATLDKDKVYLLYCRSGGRSERACQMMEGMGFTKLYNLLGGIQAWNQSE